ncbi:hypothetical protein RclHR1_00420030 [Rhizophagus clarus]|uniref:ER membrane protein complex subunit 10 n=1 Tax=Rhizophagus clarus TaxID=94130 RepID=A0A2Z6RFL9_9GLOM|nr:hypothetical protein RclHR1_00420030 [Rhizophagus clarus]GES91199.1 ER membrane protein complex subunit 10 [Rhizophagus clarus]
MISLARCALILTLLFEFLNSALSTPEYENFGTVYHKLPHHTEYSKRGVVVTTSSSARYSEFEDVLSSFDITKNLENNQLYLVKIVDNEYPNHVTKSFTKSCLLKSSNFEDKIIIHLDKNDKMFHFDYYTSSDQCNKTIDPQTGVFKTTVQTVKAVNGVAPKLNKAVPLREDGTVEKPPEEKSFIQKYWWYFIPLIILLLTGGPPEESQQGGQQQQQQQRGGQAVRPAR